MKIQKYYLLFILIVLFLSSCGIIDKNSCDCPKFNSYDKKVELNLVYYSNK